MVRGSIAMRSAAHALAPSRNRKTQRATEATRHALSFIGSACVLNGLLASLLFCVLSNGHVEQVAEAPRPALCAGLPAGRPCEKQAAWPAVAKSVPAAQRRAHG